MVDQSGHSWSQPDWKKLRHAYGSAEDLPELLEELDPDPESFVWNELWGRVCHQYSTFSASPYVLPYLLAAARGWEPEARVMPLTLAGGIVAAPETNLEGFTGVVEELGLLTRSTLDNANLGSQERVYVVQAMMAFAGDRVWGHALDRLNDGRFLAACPTCRTQLYVVIGDDAFCYVEDRVRRGEERRSVVTPVAPETLDGTGLALYTLCRASADPAVGTSICQLFGRATCPNCSQGFDVSEAVAAFENP